MINFETKRNILRTTNKLAEVIDKKFDEANSKEEKQILCLAYIELTRTIRELSNNKKASDREKIAMALTQMKLLELGTKLGLFNIEEIEEDEEDKNIH